MPDYTIVAVSDLHGLLPEIPVCDLLLIGGDICPATNHDPVFQSGWLTTDFRSWLASVPAKQSVYIAGNHDFVFEQMPELVPKDLPAVYLQDAAFQWQGLKIWGTPWQPWFFDWAFNLYEHDLAKKWALIPEDTDILVVHGPPHGYGDAVRRKDRLVCQGSPGLLRRIQEIKPRLVVFGHIHEGRGQWQLDDTILANVSMLDEKYQPIHEPWVHRLIVQ